YLQKAKAIPLSWTSPDFGQIRSYTIWRAIGAFPTRESVIKGIIANPKLFLPLPVTVSGSPPQASFIDTFNLKSSTTYTYFVTDSNKYGAKSGPSTPLVVFLKF
ncbi:MAG TPA: hypothetical protein VFB00_02530, partial [Terriglobales bacterium]|nr:hypothetical protein [Terriglobales bacterium]